MANTYLVDALKYKANDFNDIDIISCTNTSKLPALIELMESNQHINFFIKGKLGPGIGPVEQQRKLQTKLLFASHIKKIK